MSTPSRKRANTPRTRTPRAAPHAATPYGWPNGDAELFVGSTRVRLNDVLTASECVALFAAEIGTLARESRAQFKTADGERFLGADERFSVHSRDLRAEIMDAEAALLKIGAAHHRLASAVARLRTHYSIVMNRVAETSLGYDAESLEAHGNREALGKALEDATFAPIFAACAKWYGPPDGRQMSAADLDTNIKSFTRHLQDHLPALHDAETRNRGLVHQALLLVSRYSADHSQLPQRANDETHDARDAE